MANGDGPGCATIPIGNTHAHCFEETAICELLGMNCNVPTDICFSFTGFQARGGATDVHRDGWGIAFFEGRGVRVFLDPQPSCASPVAELVRHYPIRSLNVIAHIRKATQGPVGLENTHPFMRELWGRYWIFAHNGNLKGYAPSANIATRSTGSGVQVSLSVKGCVATRTTRSSGVVTALKSTTTSWSLRWATANGAWRTR